MKQIFSKKAPAAIGPYCHAVVHNDMVFCSGQLAFDPKTMELVGNNIEDQTTQVMKNIESVLSELNIGLDKIIKATIFLDNIEDFLGMNKIYEACLGGHKPARSTFEVGRLPKDALVEIECIAVL
jgi:2-iminobutanoate/2-iminopropanoate deaminase